MAEPLNNKTLDLVAGVAMVLEARGLTLGLVESCTGGLLSAEIVRRPGVSRIYRGAVVSYDYSVKENLLGISHGLLMTHGAVSRPVAIAMARAGRELLRADWVCAITGIAGPSGGSPDKPVGTVCFAVLGPGCVRSWQSHFVGSRESVQNQSAEQALRLIRACLIGEELDLPQTQRSVKNV